MPTVNGIKMQYNSGIGSEDQERSAQATEALRRAFDANTDKRTGTWENAARLPKGST
jgi:hypothetical protein